MIETSVSMLERMRREPAAGWERFVRLYTPLLMEWSRRAGVPDANVPEFVQDVISHVWLQWPKFDYDPARGRFRGWLRTVTVHRWQEACRRRPALQADTAALNSLPTPETDAFWEREYQQRLVHRALTILQSDFHPATWKAFCRVVMDGEPTAAVASDLGLSVGAIHTAKLRILKRLRTELDGLLE